MVCITTITLAIDPWSHSSVSTTMHFIISWSLDYYNSLLCSYGHYWHPVPPSVVNMRHSNTTSTGPQNNIFIFIHHVTVIVTEALVLRPLVTRRPRAHHRVNPYLCRQNETKMFSDHDETSPSIAAVSAPSVACFMLLVQQQKRFCRQFVDVSAARRGCHTTVAQANKTATN